MKIDDILKGCPQNPTIMKSIITTYTKINDPTYKKILCSISGGSDSDILVDLCTRCDISKKVDYVFFDTGIEYSATKRHLDYLEQKYDIHIERERAKKSVAYSCKHYGQPFLSKYVSTMCGRLQKHGFTWEDRPFKELYREYPNCKAALLWWCNENGENSKFNISRNKYLKEFMIQNPPNFLISANCCNTSKKNLVHSILKQGNYDLNITGVRKAEGGIRSVAYKSCFDSRFGEYDNYRPIFWYKDIDKETYVKSFNVQNSDCYTIYGLKRTGCCGCPFGRNVSYELEIVKKYEPKLNNAILNIFKDSYVYTKKFEEFKKEKKTEDYIQKSALYRFLNYPKDDNFKDDKI